MFRARLQRPARAAHQPRITVIQHSVISNVEEYDAIDVRNVEVEVRDNDTPGIYVVELQYDEVTGTFIEDERTVVMEATDWTAAGICAHTSAMSQGAEVTVPSFD